MTDINLTYQKKDPYAQFKENVLNFLDVEKNNNRIDSIIANECSKKCLRNFKNDRLDAEETNCLTNCTQRFNDSVFLGEQVFDFLRHNAHNDKSSVALGNYAKFVEETNGKFNI